MGIFRTSGEDFYICDKGYPHVQQKRVDQFNVDVLGLGDLTAPMSDVDAVAAVFDLAGFTKFCAHFDPHLSIAEYLKAFLDWLFQTVKTLNLVESQYGAHPTSKRKRLRKKHADGTVDTWATLPFFAKFMGDGVLFLWDTKGLTDKAICTIPAMMLQVCASYDDDFLPTVARGVTSPPRTLRCGIARGKVFSVGAGNDFVGPCINMASRLQKVSVQMAFARLGFDVDAYMDPHVRTHFLLKQVSIRGIGDGELIFIDERSFDLLRKAEKKLFRDP